MDMIIRQHIMTKHRNCEESVLVILIYRLYELNASIESDYRTKYVSAHSQF